MSLNTFVSQRFFIFDSLQFLSNVRGRKFLDKMLGSEKINMPGPKLVTYDNMGAVLETAGIGMNEVEFFHPNEKDPEQVVRLGEEEMETGHALKNALRRKWTVAPARRDVKYKCSPLRAGYAKRIYTLVSGSVTLIIINSEEWNCTECVLRIGDPVFVEEGQSYCILSSGNATFIETVFDSIVGVDWNPERRELVLNKHLTPKS